MKGPRVKEVLEEYRHDNLRGVYLYLTQKDIKIEPDTWCEKIKLLIENKRYITAQQEIELVAYKFLKDI